MKEEMQMTLRLDGRFDAYQAPQVKAWMKEQVAQAQAAGEPPQIIVDLRQVYFIDSAGLSALVVGQKRAREAGGTMNLFALQQPVRIILELSWLDKAFPIFETEEEARAHAAEWAAAMHAG